MHFQVIHVYDNFLLAHNLFQFSKKLNELFSIHREIKHPIVDETLIQSDDTEECHSFD